MAGKVSLMDPLTRNDLEQWLVILLISICSSLFKLVSNDGQVTRGELGIVTLKVRSCQMGMVDKTAGEMPS